MSTMIERVARAIGGEENGAPGDEPGERWRNWEPAARAAIAAMREPTDAQTHAGREATRDPSGNMREYAGITERDARDCYRAMIDAALEEKP